MLELRINEDSADAGKVINVDSFNKNNYKSLSSYLMDVSAEAQLIEMEMSDFFDYKGLYSKNSLTPIITADKKYTLISNGIEIFNVDLYSANLSIVTGDIFDSNTGELILSIPKDQKASDVLFKKPIKSVYGLKIVKDYIDWVIDWAVEWTDKKPLCDVIGGYFICDVSQPKLCYNGIEVTLSDIRKLRMIELSKGINTNTESTIYQKLGDAIECSYDESIMYQIEERLRYIMMDIHETILRIVDGGRWNVYISTIVNGNSIKVEKLNDYRIYEWMRINRPGELID